jgi:hypothetical protein
LGHVQGALTPTRFANPLAVFDFEDNRGLDISCPKTPERQGIPEALHPPPVRRNPLMTMAIMYSDLDCVRRRLHYTDEGCDPIPFGNSQAVAPINKRSSSTEVTALKFLNKLCHLKICYQW